MRLKIVIANQVLILKWCKSILILKYPFSNKNTLKVSCPPPSQFEMLPTALIGHLKMKRSFADFNDFRSPTSSTAAFITFCCYLNSIDRVEIVFKISWKLP